MTIAASTEAARDPNCQAAMRIVMAGIASHKLSRATRQRAPAPSALTDLGDEIDTAILTASGEVPPELARKVAAVGLAGLAGLVGMAPETAKARDGLRKITRELSIVYEAAPALGCSPEAHALAAYAPAPGYRASPETIRRLAKTFPNEPPSDDARPAERPPEASQPKATPPAAPGWADGVDDGPAFDASSVNLKMLTGVNAMINQATGGRIPTAQALFSRLERAERSSALQRAAAARSCAAEARPGERSPGISWAEEAVALGRLFPASIIRPSPGSTFDVESFLATPVTTWRPSGPAEGIPGIDPNHRFYAEELATIITAIRRRKNFILVGPTGCGKTTGLEQVAARLGRPFFRIPIDGEMRRRDIIGHLTQRASENGSYTQWKDGLLTRAFGMPSLIALDEFDRADPDLVYSAHEALERKSMRIIEEDNRVIPMHPGASIGATANTKGGGDPLGLYSSKTTLSEASRNRFTYWIDVGYLAPADEADLIVSAFPRIHRGTAMQVANVAEELRRQLAREEIRTACSTRQVLDIAEDIIERSSYDKSEQFALAKQAATRVLTKRACDEADEAKIRGIIDGRFK